MLVGWVLEREVYVGGVVDDGMGCRPVEVLLYVYRPKRRWRYVVVVQHRQAHVPDGVYYLRCIQHHRSSHLSPPPHLSPPTHLISFLPLISLLPPISPFSPSLLTHLSPSTYRIIHISLLFRIPLSKRSIAQSDINLGEELSIYLSI